MFRDEGALDPALFKPLEEALQARPLEVNKYRKQSGLGRSQCFGIVLQRNGHYHGSRQNAHRMDLYKLLLTLIQQIDPLLDYDGIQLNQNYQTQPHKDKNNRGESLIIGFGDYEGGDLLVEEQAVSIKHRKVFFCGSLYTHATAPWTGNRYSIVFFKVDREFAIKPSYQIVQVGNKEVLVEDIGGVVSIYNKRGECIHRNLGLEIRPRRQRKPTLSACVEIE